MLADYGDPVAAVQQLQRERSAQIAREYTCLAGVSLGRRLIWSGRPGVWYDAHLIDLGRRPDTVRPAPAADVVQEKADRPALVTADDILDLFRAQDNRPARVAEIADALHATRDRVYHYLERSGKFRKIAQGAGNSANYYTPADAPEVVDVSLTLSPALRKLHQALAEHGRLGVDELQALTGIANPTIHRACSQRPDIFAKEVERVSGETGRGRRAYVWLVDQS